MIFEPTPTSSRSPIRRALGVAALVLPVALLAGVLGAGLAGPKAESVAPGRPATPPPDPVGTPFASPSAGGSAAPQPNELAAGPHTPPSVADLRVNSVSATLDGWTAGQGSAVVAVAGYLRLAGDGACPLVTRLPGSGCARPVVIAESMGAASGSTGGGYGRHIHAVVPPGVVLPGDPGGPDVAGAGAAGAGGAAVDPFVVVIGRFGATDAGCTGDLRGCQDPFTVERVAWADNGPVAIIPGAQSPLSVRADDPVASNPGRAVQLALGPSTAILRFLLLGDALEVVDPASSSAIAAWWASPASGPVWYLRVLDVPAGPLPGPFAGLRVPQIRWAVVSQATGALIATGVATGSRATAASTATGGG